MAVEQDLPGPGPVDPDQGAGQGGLARPGLADEADRRARSHVERPRAQYVAGPHDVAEDDLQLLHAQARDIRCGGHRDPPSPTAGVGTTMRGEESSSIRVYGCRTAPALSSARASRSTISPCFITSTVSQSCSTTPRSWEMNKIAVPRSSLARRSR